MYTHTRPHSPDVCSGVRFTYTYLCAILYIFSRMLTFCLDNFALPVRRGAAPAKNVFVLNGDHPMNTLRPWWCIYRVFVRIFTSTVDRPAMQTSYHYYYYFFFLRAIIVSRTEPANRNDISFGLHIIICVTSLSSVGVVCVKHFRIIIIILSRGIASIFICTPAEHMFNYCFVIFIGFSYYMYI